MYGIKHFISDVLCEMKEQFTETQNNDIREIRISKSIECMLEANVDVEQIVQVLNKHWNVPYAEAQNRVEYQMQLLAKKSIVSYLHSQGVAETEISNYIISKNIFVRINHEPHLKLLWKNPQKLYEQFK